MKSIQNQSISKHPIPDISVITWTEVWFTHAMLLHFAEREHDAAALAGAQILPSASRIF